jgi:phosphatidylserine/phosphatidylglycerophosphate/cardiolipin synthase-like enzyme
MVNRLKTQRKDTIYIAETGSRAAIGSVQWLLEHETEKEALHHVTTANTLQVFICGEDGFKKIAQDIEKAKGSIDIICWGFDPAMALLRTSCLEKYPWVNGEPYGELLKRKATAGVKVRLLVWYNDTASAKQNSLIGYVEPNYTVYPSGVISQTWAEKNPKKLKDISVANRRQDYCTLWWREATAGQIANLEVRCRDGIQAKVQASLGDEQDKPSNVGGSYMGNVDEKSLIEGYATHHQKPILIDYDFDDGSKAVGYIMGLNSLSDYWDSALHEYDSASRELFLGSAKDAQEGNDAAAAAAIEQGKTISRKPYQDYAARLEGEVLESVNRNFYVAWDRATLLPKLSGVGNGDATAVASQAIAANRKAVPPKLAKKTGKPLRLQVLRTQPEEGYDDTEQSRTFDKTIKRGYFQASSFARGYLYLENQYFFYEEWARHLKANREAFMAWTQDAGKQSKDARLLHTIVVIPKPESAGMVPRTFDTLKQLGQSASMPGQAAYIKKDSENKAWIQDDVTKSTLKIKEPTLDEKGVLMQDGKSLGMKVLVCKMVSDGGLGKYRDIYIHSKLMMTDDSYFTLGSANMNVRSMAGDSEINIATDSLKETTALRKRVWALQAGGYKDSVGGDGSDKAIIDAYEDWKTLSENNAANIIKNKSLTGFIVTFSDDRKSSVRYG